MRLVTQLFASKTAPLAAGVQPRFQELLLRIEGRTSGTLSDPINPERLETHTENDREHL
jgi:hypothetical protein